MLLKESNPPPEPVLTVLAVLPMILLSLSVASLYQRNGTTLPPTSCAGHVALYRVTTQPEIPIGKVHRTGPTRMGTAGCIANDRVVTQHGSAAPIVQSAAIALVDCAGSVAVIYTVADGGRGCVDIHPPPESFPLGEPPPRPAASPPVMLNLSMVGRMSPVM